jgi:hypothetical protein
MRHALLVSCLLLSVAVGCGQKYSLLPVGGHVVLANGKPLVAAQVTFECAQPSLSATGVTDEQGNFRLGTLQDGDGAPAGEYRVTVVEAENADIDHPQPRQVHEKYRTPDASGLKFTVDKQHTSFEIKLDPPAKR